MAFFLALLLFACAVKALSIYAGARLAGETPKSAVHLAVAMNARGGPGIVLASLAYEAKIVNESFYAILVMLSLVTSLLAGSWLDAAVLVTMPAMSAPNIGVTPSEAVTPVITNRTTSRTMKGTLSGAPVSQA